MRICVNLAGAQLEAFRKTAARRFRDLGRRPTAAELRALAADCLALGAEYVRKYDEQNND